MEIIQNYKRYCAKKYFAGKYPAGKKTILIHCKIMISHIWSNAFSYIFIYKVAEAYKDIKTGFNFFNG